MPLPLYYGVGYTRVVNPDPNPYPAGCILETELYHLFENTPQGIIDHGWFPVDPNRPDRPHQLILAYSVLGIPNIPTGVKKIDDVSESNFDLLPPFPNPFNPSAKVRFQIG